MTHRGWRLVLVLAAVAAGAAAGYRVHQLERQRADRSSLQQAIDDEARHLFAALPELGAGQRSYLVADQGFEYWSSRVTALLGELDSRLAHLSSIVNADDARHAVDEGRSVFADLRKLDLTVRENIEANRRSLASDVIFTDGVQLVEAASQQVESVRAMSAAATATALSGARLEQLWWLAGATSVALISLILLAFLPRSPSATEPAALEASRDAPSELYLTAPSRAPTDASRASLTVAARLCTDLARVTEAAQLTAIIERATSLLNARGIILWLADASRGELRPSLSHGYGAAGVARLGAIAYDAENAVAAAFREGTLMTVAGDGSSFGAIVAPVMSTEGSLGVLAVEVPHGVETDDHARAIVTILAAQLSALVAAAPPVQNVVQA